MRPWEPELVGRLERVEIDSAALAGNALGDSARRPLVAYLPPSYDAEPERRYPAVYVLQGYGASVGAWGHAPSSFEPTYYEEIDALFVSGGVGAPECVVVFVDGWTSVGGSQWLDSPAVGRYQTYLADDVVRAVDGRFRTLAAPQHRGVQGKSSGGYGALLAIMMRPDVFGAAASHAGDAAFEYSMLPTLAGGYRVLRDLYGGDPKAFWADFGSRRAFSKPTDFPLLICLGMAACYSTTAEVELPFDPDTGGVREDVWERWCALDPVRMIPRYATTLRATRGLWIEAGRSDEHYLDIAAGLLAAALTEAGVKHHYELFAGGHRGTDHRLPIALAYLAEMLAAPV